MLTATPRRSRRQCRTGALNLSVACYRGRHFVINHWISRELGQVLVELVERGYSCSSNLQIQLKLSTEPRLYFRGVISLGRKMLDPSELKL